MLVVMGAVYEIPKVFPTMVLGTNLVREEPDLPEAESLAANPRYLLAPVTARQEQG